MINIDDQLNLKWYQNNDQYSDGDVEDQIIELIAQNPDGKYGMAIYNHLSWPVLYHLTNVRQNILNWYEFKPDASVLEIGCGMGAITQTLCDRCGSVTAVELSKRRATAAWLRNQNAGNLEVIVGNLNDIEFDKKFDYITLIGVLEYQGQYTQTDNPYVDFLDKIRGLLKPDGKLLIAIENKYGLKYWCGAMEDHTSVPFDGMNQYKIGNGQARTFSQKELKDLVMKSGFQDSYFYYPMPDYKLPSMIYSEDYLPQKPFKKYFSQYYMPNTTLVADEAGIYDDLLENGVYEFFANSFLVECSNRQIEKKNHVQYAVSSVERSREYGVITTVKDQQVYKEAAYSGGENHILTTARNLEHLEACGMKVVPFQLIDEVLVSERCKSPEMIQVLLEACYSKDEALVYHYFDLLIEELSKTSEETHDNIIYQLNIAKPEQNIDFGMVSKVGYIDMVFKNAFWDGTDMVWIDQEWTLENVPLGYTVYRNIHELFTDYTDLSKYIDPDKLIDHYHLRDAWKYYVQLEQFFYKSILDCDMKYSLEILRNTPQDIYEKNIKKLCE